MQLFMLKSKIHGARITDKQLHYDGSITLDTNLLEAANMLPGEQVHVLNLNNGHRFVTYTIPAPSGSGAVMLNGPAARLGEIGDQIIILSYCVCEEPDARKFKAKVIVVDENNRPCGNSG